MSSAHPSAELRAIYQRRFAGKGEYRNRIWRVLVESYFAQWLSIESVVLDLGCGHCEFINNVRCGRRFAMDLNPDSIERAAAGVEVLTQSCSDRWPVADDSLDVVFTSNFFEHLPTKGDLRATLIEARRCLRAGGRIIALGPNIRYLPGAYWDFYDHYLPLTERSLAEVMAETGFTLEQQIARFLPYTMSSPGSSPPTWLLRLYLRLKFVWPFFGKQFLVIAAK